VARLVLAAALLAAVALAAGCGGSDDGDGDGETSATTQWADDLCSATSTWKTSLQESVDTLREGNVSSDSLEGVVDDMKSATSTFVDELQGLGRPDTESGQQAQESLERLSGELEDGVQTIEDAFDDVSGVSGLLTAVSTVSTTLSSMGSDLTSTLDEIRDLDPGGEIEEAFDQAGDCD
jgi:hypothetical protein